VKVLNVCQKVVKKFIAIVITNISQLKLWKSWIKATVEKKEENINIMCRRNEENLRKIV